MIYSLRLRLLLALIVVVLVALGTVALVTSRITAAEFQSYIEQDLQRNRHLIETVLSYYRAHENPAVSQQMVRDLEQLLDERVIVTNAQERIVAASDPALIGQPLSQLDDEPAVIISRAVSSSYELPRAMPGAAGQSPMPDVQLRHVQDELLFFGAPGVEPAFVHGLVRPPSVGARTPSIAIRRTPGTGLGPIEAGFISKVNQALLLAVTAAGLVAVLVSMALSRRILGPVETLTEAARKMEKGDLSQRVAVEARDEIGALTHAFNAMADGLARLEELRRRMVSDIAHELRTPLTNIRAYLEALRDGIADPTPALIDSLHEETMLLNRLIEDLQELALAEAGQLRLVRQQTEITTLVERAVSAVQPVASEKRLALELRLPPRLPALEIDAERISQVLRNLLANAIRHTPPGGSITVIAQSLPDELQISVHDTGSGILPEDLPYIFERFFRADRSRSRATGGAGLGLAIAKQLIEAHGGRIWAESTPGAGARFTISLPVSRFSLK